MANGKTNTERLNYLIENNARLEEGQKRIEQKLDEFLRRHEKLHEKWDGKCDELDDKVDKLDRDKVNKRDVWKTLSWLIGIAISTTVALLIAFL